MDGCFQRKQWKRYYLSFCLKPIYTLQDYEIPKISCRKLYFGWNCTWQTEDITYRASGYLSEGLVIFLQISHFLPLSHSFSLLSYAVFAKNNFWPSYLCILYPTQCGTLEIMPLFFNFGGQLIVQSCTYVFHCRENVLSKKCVLPCLYLWLWQSVFYEFPQRSCMSYPQMYIQA